MYIIDTNVRFDEEKALRVLAKRLLRNDSMFKKSQTKKDIQDRKCSWCW